MTAERRFCEICKKSIDCDRLEAAHESRLCTQHALAIREFGGEFIVTSAAEVTSKQGSLKKNYGGVTISKLRNDVAVAKLKARYESREGK